MSGRFEKRLLDDMRNKEFRDAFVETHIRTGIAYQISNLRNGRNWSQDELAKRIDTKQSVVARLENPDYGKFTLSTLINLASAFDVALLIKFVGFGELLARTNDLSPKALSMPSFGEDPWLRLYKTFTFSTDDSYQYVRNVGDFFTMNFEHWGTLTVYPEPLVPVMKPENLVPTFGDEPSQQFQPSMTVQ